MPPKFALPILTPCGSLAISMSFPGMARHINILRFSFVIDLGDRHTVAKENAVSNFRSRYEIEQNISDCSMPPDLANSHVIFERHRDDFTVEQIHGTSTPFCAGAALDRATATTWPRAIPPSLGGTRWCQYGLKPASDNRRTACSTRYLFWKHPPVRRILGSPTLRAIATMISANVL